MKGEGFMMGHYRTNPAGSCASMRQSGGGRRLWMCVLVTLLPLILIILPGCYAEAPEESPWSQSTIPAPSSEITDGRAIVERAVTFMNGQQELAFEAMVTYGAVQEDGQKVHFDMLQKMAIRKPDQLFWMTLFDDASSHSAWFNRGEFTLVKQPANLWGQVIVPPSIGDGVSRISSEYRIDVPFVDILSGDPLDLWLGEDTQSVDYVGPAWIGGWWTDHVAIRKSGVDFELWFRQGEEPFPMRIELVFTAEAQLPGYSARFERWSTTLTDKAIPEFVPPTDSERVEVVPVVSN